MNRFVNRLYRLVQDLAGIEDPPQTRLSREEAIELARAAAERAGLDLDEPIVERAGVDLHAPINAEAVREGEARRVVWVVVSNADLLHGQIHVKIDDATGDVIEVWDTNRRPAEGR